MDDFDSILEALGETEAILPRNKMQQMRDFLNDHTEVRQDVATLIHEGEYDPLFDVQYRVTQTLETASQANSNSLASFTPVQLFGYAKRAINESLSQYGQKIIRGRLVALQLTHDSDAHDSDDS